MFLLFDLDGVLVDFRELHKEAFITAWNRVNNTYSITSLFHDTHLEACSTRQKIKRLSDHFRNNFCEKEVYALKQQITCDLLEKANVYKNVQKTIQWLIEKNIPFGCCSNSIKSTILTSLQKIGPIESFKFILSNEDVLDPKPAPDIYNKAILCSGVAHLNDILVFEDSKVGKQSAKSAGLHVIDIIDSLDLTPKFMEYVIQHRVRPIFTKINVVIPMAGLGSRFSNAGYTVPKPFLPLHGRPMYETVIKNIVPIELFDIVDIHVIVRNEHKSMFSDNTYSNIHVHTILSATEGAACTILTLKEYINNDTPLVIANSDQYLEWNSIDFYNSLCHPDWDGVISTFYQNDPSDTKWSYAKINGEGEVTQVIEKKVISNIATTGIYGWKHGYNFVKDAEEMILNNDRVKGEFYVCPVYNYSILHKQRIRTLNCRKMWGLGVPNDYELFLREFNYNDL